MKWWCGVALLLTCLTALAVALPQPVGRVNDFANLLDPATRQELDALLEAVGTETTAQIAVVTVETLEGMTVEEYASRLFREWGVGQKDVDNGVLVVVAPIAREMRIEVGYGLEDVLPDGLAGQIIQDDFLPQFKSGDFRAGILQGVGRVAAVVRGNHILSSEERRALEEPDRPSYDWVFILFMGPFVAIGAFVLGLGFGNRMFFLVLWGAIFGGVGFVFSLTLAPWAVWTHGTLAITAATAGYWVGRFGAGYVRPSDKKGWIFGATSGGSSGRSGSSRSSSSSSGSSSRSSSGGSFGGGRSGGGGASGRW